MLDYEASIKVAGATAARKRLRWDTEQEADTVTEEKMADARGLELGLVAADEN